MQFDLTRIAATLTELRAAGAQLANRLDDARAAGDEVFEALRPHTHEWATGDVPLALTDELRTQLAGRLDDAVMEYGAARAGIDDAFGAGTWMSDVVEQQRGFHAEARDALLGRTLGDLTPDYALDLLRQNALRSRDATRALREGDVAAFMDTAMRSRIKPADAARFEQSASYARVMAG